MAATKSDLARAVKHCTLLLLTDGGNILLGMKKRGFGAGKFNGFGGKIEPRETIQAGALREMVEESGVTPTDAVYKCHLVFEFEGHPELLHVHVFRATSFEGEPSESDEMKPQWFPLSEIPYGTMWPDDRLWLPLLLSGKSLEAKFLFRGHDVILSHSIAEVADLPLDPATTILVHQTQGPITA